MIRLPASNHRLVPMQLGQRPAAERRQGAMLVLICVMIFAFMVTVAFSVDIAYMHLVKSELRTATDAAAKAAAEALARTQDIRQSLDRGEAIAFALQQNATAAHLREASHYSLAESLTFQVSNPRKRPPPLMFNVTLCSLSIDRGRCLTIESLRA